MPLSINWILKCHRNIYYFTYSNWISRLLAISSPWWSSGSLPEAWPSIHWAWRCGDQGSPNPNPMSAKLHRFATKTGVRDSFALGLEADRHEEIVVSKFERKKLAKVKPTYKKEKYFEKLAHYVPSNSTQSPITLFQCIETFVKFAHCSQFRRCCCKGISLMSPWSLKIQPLVWS